MKKAVITIFAILLLATFANFANALSLDKNNWAVVATPGQTLTNTFTFTTGVNDSQSLTLSADGAVKNWLSFPSSISIGASSTGSFTATLTIPSGATNQTYAGSISYSGTSNGTIIVNVFTQQTQTTTSGCRLITFPNSYPKTVQAESLAIKQVNVLLTDCSQSVSLQNMDIIGDTVVGSDGKDRPVRLDDVSLGQILPGQQISITLTVDTAGIATGVYTSALRIDGITQNATQISATMPITIAVTQGTTPVGNASSLAAPNYQVPDSVNSGSDLTVTVENLNPNLQPSVQPSPFLIGKPVVVTGNKWSFSATVNKSEGEIEVQIATLFKNNPIGALYVKKVKVLPPGYTAPIGNLTISFIPPIDGIVSAEITTVMLCRDSASQNIIECKIYVNNVEAPTKQATIKPGQTYLFSASAPNYATFNKEIKTQQKNLQLAISSYKPEHGSKVFVFTSPNATVTVDGAALTNNSFIAAEVGDHQIKAAEEGQEVSQNFTVTPTLNITSQIPLKLEKNVPISISLNKPANWAVLYKPDNKTATWTTLIPDQESSVITFTPPEPGIYMVTLRGNAIATYVIKGSFFSGKWMWLVVIAVIAVVIILIIIKLRGSAPSGGGGAGGYFGELGEGNAVEVMTGGK